MSGNHTRLSRLISCTIRALHCRIPGYGLAGIAAMAALVLPSHSAGTNTHAAVTSRGHILDAVRAYRAKVASTASRAASAALPLHTVRAGESISSVAADTCQAAADWTGIYAASRRAHLTGYNANNVNVGQNLAIECDQVPSMLARAIAPKPVYTPPVTTVAVARPDTGDGGDSVRSPAPQGAVAAPAAAVGGSSAVAGPRAVSGSFEACVIARESGGQLNVTNASGHYGLYQFSYSTWTAHGGSAGSFGHASAGEQHAVFAATVAADGHSDWSPYDGC